MDELDLLRRIAATRLPFRLRTPEDFGAAKTLMNSGFVKVAFPLARNGKNTYGKQAIRRTRVCHHARRQTCVGFCSPQGMVQVSPRVA